MVLTFGRYLKEGLFCMKKWFFLVTLVVTSLFLPFAGSTTAFASSRHLSAHTTQATNLVWHNASTKALSANLDPNDPYDSGCAYRNAYVANSGTLSVAGYVVHAENWYSQGCGREWTRVWWNSGSAVQLHESIYDYTGVEFECYPTNCSDFYTGGLSPSWTDMIVISYGSSGARGTTTYVGLTIQANGQTVYSPGYWLPY
jgi:hypothetical protein